MDTENVNLSLGQLQTRIQRMASAPINDESELEKRKIWRDLEVLKMAIDYQAKKISPEALKVRPKDFTAAIISEFGVFQPCMTFTLLETNGNMLITRILKLYIQNWPRL
jgi:hypothetical protein